MANLLMTMLAAAITLCALTLCRGIEVRSLYPSVIQDQNNLHRNIISLNLLTRKPAKGLPADKMALLETQLKLQVATRLWSPQAQEIPTEDLALYIQAMHATCINPFNFFGVNLVDMLRHRVSGKSTVQPFESHLTAFTMCLLSKNESDFKSLMGSESQLMDLIGRRNDSADSDRQHLIHVKQRSNEHKMSTNDCLMKAMAISCYAKLVPQNRSIRIRLNDLMGNVFHTQDSTTGSFNDSVLTTSLALQALSEAGLDRLSFLWDRKKAVNFINTRVREMDIDATLAYYLVPAFHKTWHEIQCWNDTKLANQDADKESARDWTRALNVVLNQGDASVNVTLSRWVYDSSGEKTKVSVNIPPEESLLKALKEAVKTSTTYHYDPNLKTGAKNQTVSSNADQSDDTESNTKPGENTAKKRSIKNWFRSLIG
jgi:hypothetical protein